MTNRSDTTRLRLQGMAMLAVALGVGVLAGVAGERVRSAATAPPPRPPFERGARGERGLPRPFQQLDLSEAQREQISTVMESRRARTESLMQQLLTPLSEEMDTVRSQIADILTPAQLEQLNAAIDSMGSRRGFWGARRGRGFRRGMGPPTGRQR